MLNLSRELLDRLREHLARAGAMTRFFGRLLVLSPGGFLRPRLLVEQVYNTGALSLVIIMTSGLFVGMVMGLQGHDLLSRIGSEDSLGTGAALTLLKELGPVVTALLFAGRAGTALASEIGLTPEALYRTVAALEVDAEIKRSGNVITLIRHDRT